MKSMLTVVVALMIVVTSAMLTGCQSNDMSMTAPSEQVSPMLKAAPNAQDGLQINLGGKGGKTTAPPDTSAYLFAR
jgi:hypothetical protein